MINKILQNIRIYSILGPDELKISAILCWKTLYNKYSERMLFNINDLLFGQGENPHQHLQFYTFCFNLTHH